MITKLELNNFRCFQNFVLDGIRPVTLIAGANGVGKSTILESIFLFNDRSSHDVFIKINNIRGINYDQLSAAMLWEHLFANHDKSSIIKIALTIDNREDQCLTLERDNSFSLYSIPEMKSQAHIIGFPIPDTCPLKLNYTDSTNNVVSHFTVTANNIALTSSQALLPVSTTHYICSKIVFRAQIVAEWFSKVFLEKQKQQCLDALCTLDARITDALVLSQGGTSTLYVRFGSTLELPISTLGDGINKLMSIVLVMLSHPGATILIDEIENGFHYSFFPKLWEIIGKLANETECQVIATSHSYECIRGAECLAVNNGNPNLFRFVRLDRHNNVIISKNYENEQFVYAVNNDWEVR